ncbi:MAG: 2'-5' RNA ligase family protein [Pseudomonadota bacterium]
MPFAPFELRFGRAALWPHGVAVLEPNHAPARLLALHAALAAALSEQGVATDARPYRPHVTLARRAAGALAPEPAPLLRWRIGGYALMESTLGADGAYRVVQRYT